MKTPNAHEYPTCPKLPNRPLAIAIPTIERADKQIFLSNLPTEYHSNVTIYAPEEDCVVIRKQYPHCNYRATPAIGIAKTRQIMMEEAGRYLFMVDDDVRITESVWSTEKQMVTKGQKLSADTPELWNTFFSQLVDALAIGAGMVGVTYDANSWQLSREQYTSGIRGPARLWSVYAINAKYANKFGLRFDNIPCMEDFDFNLQLLRSGIPTGTLTQYQWGQSQSNADGGCSTYRTTDLQRQSALTLKARHGNFVTVVEKESNWGNGMEMRTDARVQWAKAAKSGQCAQLPKLPKATPSIM